MTLKNVFLIGFLCLFCTDICGQNKEDRNGNLVGKLEFTDLTQGKFKAWFQPEYDNYQPNNKVIKKIKKTLEGVSIKVFMGTWCHDSHRELPRFYKLMKELDASFSNFEVVGLTRGKKTPDNLQKGYNIKHTPSFIFFRNGKEIGRYVEQPRETMEKDFLKILKGKKYKHTYQK